MCNFSITGQRVLSKELFDSSQNRPRSWTDIAGPLLLKLPAPSLPSPSDVLRRGVRWSQVQLVVRGEDGAGTVGPWRLTGHLSVCTLGPSSSSLASLCVATETARGAPPQQPWAPARHSLLRVRRQGRGASALHRPHLQERLSSPSAGPCVPAVCLSRPV